MLYYAFIITMMQQKLRSKSGEFRGLVTSYYLYPYSPLWLSFKHPMQAWDESMGFKMVHGKLILYLSSDSRVLSKGEKLCKYLPLSFLAFFTGDPECKLLWNSKAPFRFTGENHMESLKECPLVTQKDGQNFRLFFCVL